MSELGLVNDVGDYTLHSCVCDLGIACVIGMNPCIGMTGVVPPCHVLRFLCPVNRGSVGPGDAGVEGRLSTKMSI